MPVHVSEETVPCFDVPVLSGFADTWILPPLMFSPQEGQVDSFETCTCLSLGRAKPRLIVPLKNLLCFCRDRLTNSKNRPGLSSSNSASPKCHLEAVRIQFLFIRISIGETAFYWARCSTVTCPFSLVILLLWTKPKPLEVRGGMGRDTFPVKFYPYFNFSQGIFLTCLYHPGEFV